MGKSSTFQFGKVSWNIFRIECFIQITDIFGSMTYTRNVFKYIKISSKNIVISVFVNGSTISSSRAIVLRHTFSRENSLASISSLIVIWQRMKKRFFLSSSLGALKFQRMHSFKSSVSLTL